MQHVGSDADVEANFKLKGLEEKLAAVGQNISLRVKVKDQDPAEEDGREDEQQQQQHQELDHHRVPQDNGTVPQNQGGRLSAVGYDPHCTASLHLTPIGDS